MVVDLQQALVVVGLVTGGGGLVWAYFKFVLRQGDRGEAAAEKSNNAWMKAHTALSDRLTEAERRIALLPTSEKFSGVERRVGALDNDIAKLSESVRGLKQELIARDNITLARLDGLGKQMDGVDSRLQTVINHIMSKEVTKP